MNGPFRPPMIRVSPEEPCPVCGKPDWCLVATDGSAAICPRTEAGATKSWGEAGWLHILDPRRPPQGEDLPRPQRAKSPKPKPLFFQELLNVIAPPNADVFDVFAMSLGLTPQSLARLNVRRVSDGSWYFPERDETGLAIGVNKRFPDGSKKRWFGGAAGLTYADDWDTGVGPLLLPEGASDTCALMDLGLSAIGRPSNRAGCALLGAMLKTFERPIVVLGEYDEKPDGRWPGKEGAIATVTDLAKRLERPIAWALPPDRAKDARHWLIQHGGNDPSSLGNSFLDGLILETVSPPASIRIEHRKGPPITLDDYRLAQVQARRRSLDQPAVYLDRSPTGTGKSFADLVAVESLIGREATAA